ncbi:unnamed protein product [Spirodela intermedia]|uniref:Exostosin GT47 domain-containing protein n=1 Tax=Spirodela intermedia TaxID=51605 RepID=A0A7I8L0Q3_SPIIN|nr:unnamed protein product [Spirodela intermedia]
MTLFTAIGKTILPSHSPNGSPSPSYDSGSAAFLSLENGETLNAAGGVDGDLGDVDRGGDGEEERGFSVDLGNGTRLRDFKDTDVGYMTTENSEKAQNVSGFPPTGGGNANATSVEFHKEEKLNGDPSPGEEEKKKKKKKKKRRWQDGMETISLEGREIIEDCILAKDRQERARLRQSAMSISDMDQLASKNRESCSVVSPTELEVPRWSSPRDREILDAKKQIMNARTVKSDPELYPPIFRNFSMFRRSYDLMESLLKVYIYKEGEQPIFHQPELTGIYSSEGWFMRHMEGSRRFLVEEPRQAHLFYMPFSSHFLQMQLYVPDSHSHDNLIEFLQKYVSTIAAKYPFWNRTDGADHFLVSCHDWATHETWRAMGTSVRALCNADTTEDFVVGKDVSLPETNVRSVQDPARNLGGRPGRKRTLLAFFAGQMHGYLRPALLQHWGDDPDMVILGPLPPSGSGGGSKGKKAVNYAQYMKSSRFCVCPRGFEVNSPRVVEAIFYECVPVIISDNFVPPFFEVLDWGAFSVIIEEKDVPRLKEILLSISRPRYLALQTGVRKVQKHFLWHDQPTRYDLFHMILHSVWFNRVFQLRSSPDGASTVGR